MTAAGPPKIVGTRGPTVGAAAAVAGLVAAGAGGIALSVAIASGGPILAAEWDLLGQLAAWAALWAVAVACALRLPRPVSLALVFALAAGLRLAALAGPPTLSDDLYRYAWDGRVQAAGIDPYRHTPASRQLVELREPWLWPGDEGCRELDRGPRCSRINRATEKTIYPPLAQRWFAAVYRLAGIDARHKAWQVAGLVGDLALLALLPFALRAWGRDERWAALYALSPVPVVEVVNNGHVDGLAATLLVGALWAAGRRRPGWAGALVGAAALVKLYPAIVVVGLAGAALRAGSRAGRRAGPRAAAVPLLTAAAVAAAGYLPHVVAVGAKVLGYLPGYLREEQYDQGGRYLLAGLVPGPAALTAGLAAAAVVATVAWVLARRPPPPRAFAALLGVLLLAATPVQPWYAVTLLAAATVAARPAWSAVAAAGYPYFFAVILGASARTAIGRWSYGLAALAVALAALAVREREPDPEAPGRQDQPGPADIAAAAPKV